MITDFCDRDLPSQCHCIHVAFFLHGSRHYLFAAQYNVQQAFLKQYIFQKNL